MADEEEVIDNDELLDSNEVAGDDSEPKSGSRLDLFEKSRKLSAPNDDFIETKTYTLDPFKGREIMGTDFRPDRPDFQEMYKIAQKNHEISLAKQKAEEQGLAGEIGGAITQAAAEIVGGTIEGIGYLLDFQSMTDGTFGEGNWFSNVGTAIKDWTREVTPIHVDPETEGKFAPWSTEWWFSNTPSVASAVSIMIPVAGWARGVGMAGKLGAAAAKGVRALNYTARAGKAAKGLGGLNNIDDAVRAGMAYRNKFSKIYDQATRSRALNAVHQGIVSRHIESNMEASGVYKEEYDKVLAETGDELKAKLAASEAAAFSYRGNSIMLLQDIPQYFLLGRGMKATKAFNGRAQMLAAGESGTKGAMQSAGRYIADMASEFGEEAYQFVIGEEAMHFGDVMAGIAEDSNFTSRFGEYVSDGEFWTSGFFGAIGAGVMQGTKPVFDKIRGKTTEDSRIKELEERGAKFAYHNKKLRAAAESGLPDVYEQAMLDASTDMAVTAAREENLGHYIKQLEGLKTADAETREKMGVDETFTENIDRLISDAKAIETIWNKNNRRFDPSILPQVVQSKFIISKLDNDRGKLINQINEDRNSIHRYNELSADGRNVFDAKLKIKSAEKGVEHAKKILADKSRKLTEEQKERIQEYINQQEAIIAAGNAEVSAIESDDSITLPDSDKEILKLLNNDAIIGETVSNMEKLSWQDQLIDAHIMRLNKLTNREIIKEAAKHKANLDKGREDFRRVQDLYTQIYKGAKEEILGKRKTIGFDEDGKPIKEESEDWENAEELTQRYEVELTPKEKQAAIDEAKEILARTTDEKDRENIAKMIEEMETVVRDGISRFQRQEARKAKALQELENKRLNKIKRLNAAAKGRITKEIATEVALAYDQYAMIDHAYDDTPLGELFFKNTDVLPVFHNGERGILYKSDDTAELVFQSSSSGEEFIVSGSLEDTVSNLNLGVLKDSYFPVDFVINGKKKLVKDEETGEIIASISTAENYTSFGLSGDNASIWIGDSELSHIGTMPQESLNYDEAGNLKSVTLINGKGEEVEITGEILMYEVADMLLVYQLAIEQFLGKDQTFTSGGKEYQVDFNATNPMQSKVFEVLRDEKGEILMTEEVLPGKRNIYNKDGSHNKKGRILNEITGQFREQLAKDIVGYTEGDVEFAPRIQKERETVREYIERGEGPLAKRKGETKEEYALRTGDTRGISVKNRENEIVKLQKRLEDPNISEAERTATLEKISQERQQQKEDEQRKAELAEKSRYAIKGTNKWILKEQNEEVTDTEDVPTEPPGGPTDKKKPDETKPKRESTKNPKTEEEITDQFTDPDISDAELQTKAISKVFEDIEPSASKLTEELKDAQSIEDLEGLLNEKQQELAGSANVLKEGVAEDGSIIIPDEVRGTVETVAVVEGDEINTFETVTPMEGATESSLNAEERDQLEADIIRIKDFISKVKTEFATIKDEAIKAQLEAEEKLKRESTVLIDEDVEIGDVEIERKRSAVFTGTTDVPPSTLEVEDTEPSFELESTEPAEDSRRSRSTQQNTDRVDGSISTSTYLYRTLATATQIVLDFDSNDNPIRKESIGVEINDDLLANPNLIKEGGKLYLQPLENDWFTKKYIKNEYKSETGYFLTIPIIVYLENENGEKEAVGVIETGLASLLEEEERNIRKAIYDNWKNNNKSGYTVGNLTLNDNGTLVGFNRGPNLRTVKDREAMDLDWDQQIIRPAKSVLKPIADRWKAMYQYDDSGNIVLRKNEDIEFKFGYVTRPKEAAPTLNVPAADVLLETAAKNTKVDSGQAGQIYGFVLNGNGDYVPVKLSTSNIDLNAQETITGLLTSEKFTEKDLKRIQEIIYVQYSNDELIEKMDLLISTDEKTKTIDPVIQILLNTKTNQPYIQFIHNKKIYSLNISELNKERPNIARKKIEGPVGNQKITVDDSVTIDQILANDFNGISPLAIISKIIANKKYNVQGDKLNTKAGTQYTSPITNKEYNTYNDYLIGRPDINGNENTEFAGGSILQTDVQPSDGGNYFYDSQLQIEIGEQRFQEEDSKVEKEVAEKEEIDEDKDDFDMFPDVQASTDPLGTIGGIPSMSPLGRFNMFLNKFNIQLSGFSSMKPGKVSQITQQFKNEAKVFGLEGRVSTNGSLYLYDPSAKKALVKNNSPSNNPNFKLKLSRVKPIKTDYPYQTTRTRTGRTIFQLGITPIQWATLPRKEKENIINCN